MICAFIVIGVAIVFFMVCLFCVLVVFFYATKIMVKEFNMQELFLKKVKIVSSALVNIGKNNFTDLTVLCIR
jgi:hypothetical protein